MERQAHDRRIYTYLVSLSAEFPQTFGWKAEAPVKTVLGIGQVKTTVNVNSDETLINPEDVSSANRIGSVTLQDRLTAQPGRSLSDLVNQEPAYFEGQYGWDKNTLSLSASATGTDRYLDPPVLQNYTSHGTPADFMAHYERDLIDNDRIGIILRREQSKFLVPIGISRSVDARLQFEF